MFGAFCPLPLRLGGTEETGVSAEQWIRLANDAAAMAPTRCLAVITFNNTTPPTILSYIGCHGSGVGVAPTVSYVALGVADIEWSPTYTDDQDTVRQFVIKSVRVQGHTYGGSSLTNFAETEIGIGDVPSAVRVSMFDPSGAADNGIVSVAVFGTFGEESRHTDYGGDSDKRDNESEAQPYAYTFYSELGTMFGSAISQSRTGYIHALKLATARVFAGEMRASERYSLNAMPVLAENASETWCKALGVPFVEEMPGAMRRKLLRSRIAAAQGPSIPAVDSAVEVLLGNSLVTIHRYVSNDLDDPPDITAWYGGTAGSQAMNIGGGTYLSARSHLSVEVVEPNLSDWADYRELLDVHLFRLLDTILPAHATFDWGSVTEGGFILDVSLLGVGSL